jgi:hypothetical protein
MRAFANVAIAAALLGRGRLRKVEDVPTCFPFKGPYDTGCEFVRNMCELSSYHDDVANPSWCSSYAHEILYAWKDCEFKIRMDSTLKAATKGKYTDRPMSVTDRIANRVPNIFGLEFVSCFKKEFKEPQCIDICALHSGACQVLCGNFARCVSECQPGSFAMQILDRTDIQTCVDTCLVDSPNQPLEANGTWPNTPVAAFPPETRDDQPARLARIEAYHEREKAFATANERLTNATRVNEKLWAHYHNLDPNVTLMAASSPPWWPKQMNASLVQPIPNPVFAPVGYCESCAESPLLNNVTFSRVEDQIATINNETFALQKANAKLAKEISSAMAGR